MANEKILNTRIQLKYDSYEKWNSSSIVLKAGEIAIAHLGPANKDGSTHTSGQHPVLIKVGDNAHTFAQLPWLSALAADVYAWAKKENPDWNDFPALPIEVIDNGTGKFVTDVEYANNKITITRSNVGWADIENKPNLVNTIEAADASLEIAPTSGDVKAKAKISAVEGNTLELKNDGLYVPAPAEVTLPSVEDNAVAFSFVTEVDQASGAVSNSKAKLVQGANITLTQEAAGGDITITGKDWSGEIAAVDTGVMSVSGKDAIVATGDDAVEVSLALDNSGNVVLSQSATGLKATIDLSEYRKIADDEDTKYGLAYDSDAKQIKIVAGGDKDYIDASDFIVDGMLASVVADQTANTLTFTWNTDGGETVTIINLSDIADIYTGVDGTTIKVDVSSDNKVSAEVKTNSLKDGHIASDAAIAETKLAQGVQDALALARTAIQEHQSLDNYKTKQTAYSAEGSTVKTVTKVEQNANGEIAVTYGEIAFPAAPDYTDEFNGKKNVQEAKSGALTGAEVVGSWTQDEQGVVSITARTLTPTDIGAQPAGDYATKTEMSNQDAAILAEAQKYADSLNHEDTKYTAAENGGLKLNEDNSFAVAEHGVGASNIKAEKGYTGEDAEVWIFYCGSATELI